MEANWDKLRHPSKNLRPLVPTPEKLVDFSARLIHTPLYLSDEHRNPTWVDMLVATYFSGPLFNWFYEIGNWQGVLGFCDIWPGWKAEVMFKFWDKKMWGADFCRELKDVADLFTDELKIRRLYIQTPDEHMTKLLKRLGFKVEGRFKDAFRWNGKSYTLHCMRRIKEG